MLLLFFTIIAIITVINDEETFWRCFLFVERSTMTGKSSQVFWFRWSARSKTRSISRSKLKNRAKRRRFFCWILNVLTQLIWLKSARIKTTKQHCSSILFAYTTKSPSSADECTVCPIEIEFDHVSAAQKWFKIIVNGSEIKVFMEEKNTLMANGQINCPAVELRPWEGSLSQF